LQESKRAWVIPSKVEPLYTCWWEDGKVAADCPTLLEIRENVQRSLMTLRQDHKRSLNPTPYKVTFVEVFGPSVFRAFCTSL
jgi:nicotinate phosphoribosyltransferase